MRMQMPPWAWLFCVPCLVILVVARLSPLPLVAAAVGGGAAAATLAVSRIEAPLRRRLVYASLCVAVAWSLFALLWLTGGDPIWSAAWVGAAVGAVVGLIPAIMAERRRRPIRAVIALAACAIGGAVGGILVAAPLAAVATLAVRRGTR